MAFQESPALAREILSNALYLEDSGIEIDGVRFWGSPWTPNFMDWAFMLDRDELLYQKWKAIPEHTDVLITHGPPKGIGDLVAMHGCLYLQNKPLHSPKTRVL